jgi:hypothetical protein
MPRVNILLAMAKDINGIRPIIVSEVFLWLISHFIVLQHGGPFQKHLSPHQFGVSTPKGYEAIPFNIQALFDLHPDWVVIQINVNNIFNSVFQIVIFKELCDVERPLANIVPFTMLFYGTHFPIYYQHKQHVEGVIIIESSSSTR